ncbi:MAG: hypothetical protein AB7S90_08715 [Marinobacterium sp.]
MIKLGQQLPGLIVQVVGGLAINSFACTLTMSIVRMGCAYRAAHTGETVVAVVAESQATFTQYIAIRVVPPHSFLRGFIAFLHQKITTLAYEAGWLMQSFEHPLTNLEEQLDGVAQLVHFEN